MVHEVRRLARGRTLRAAAGARGKGTGCEATVQRSEESSEAVCGVVWERLGRLHNVWATQGCMRGTRDVLKGGGETRTLQVELLRLRHRAY